MFFPFRFLHETTEDSAAPGPPDPINTNFIDFGQIFSNQDSIDFAEIQQNIQNGDYTLWEPPTNPLVLEDLDTGTKTVIWNTQNDGHVSTVGIMLHYSNDGLEWCNKVDFQLKYASAIAKSEQDIRTLYYILNIIMNETDEETLIHVFSDTVNLTPECWYHWRLVQQYLPVPLQPISTMIDRSRTISTTFDAFHNEVLGTVIRLVQEGENRVLTSKLELQNMITNIDRRTHNLIDTLEHEVNTTIEKSERINEANKIVLQQGLTQMQEYSQEVNNARMTVTHYIDEMTRSIESIKRQNTEAEEHQIQLLQEQKSEANKALSTISFMQQTITSRLLDTRNDVSSFIDKMNTMSHEIQRHGETLRNYITRFEADNDTNRSYEVRLSVPDMQDTVRQLANTAQLAIQKTETALNETSTSIGNIIRAIKKKNEEAARLDQHTYNQLVSTAIPLIEGIKAHQHQIVTASEEGRKLVQFMEEMSNIISRLEKAPPRRANFEPAMKQIEEIASCYNNIKDEANWKTNAVIKMQEKMMDILFALEEVINQETNTNNHHLEEQNTQLTPQYSSSNTESTTPRSTSNTSEDESSNEATSETNSSNSRPTSSESPSDPSDDEAEDRNSAEDPNEWVRNISNALKDIDFENPVHQLTQIIERRITCSPHFAKMNKPSLAGRPHFDVLTMMLCCTGVLPPVRTGACMCGYPGCPVTFEKPNIRKGHWRNIHNSDYTEITLTHMLEGIYHLFTRWEKLEQDGMRTPITEPVMCPFCQNEPFVTSKASQLKQHIKSMKDNVHQDCYALSTKIHFMWAVIIAALRAEMEISISSVAKPTRCFSCPHCGDLFASKGQVSAHIAGKHREAMRASQRRNPGIVHVTVEFADEPFPSEIQPRQRQNTPQEQAPTQVSQPRQRQNTPQEQAPTQVSQPRQRQNTPQGSVTQEEVNNCIAWLH